MRNLLQNGGENMGIRKYGGLLLDLQCVWKWFVRLFDLELNPSVFNFLSLMPFDFYVLSFSKFLVDLEGVVA